MLLRGGSAVALLVECISVVLRKVTLNQMYPGGESQFRADWQIPMLLADDDLISFSFMDPNDADEFAEAVQASGIGSEEIAIVSHANGILEVDGQTCTWLQFGTAQIYGQTVTVCFLTGSRVRNCVMPPHWKPETQADRTTFNRDDPRYRFDRTLPVEGGGTVDVYVDKETGTEYYVGRPPLEKSRQNEP